MTELINRLNAAFVGRYRIERELGRGGMARVFLAQDLKHERRVAIKILRPELAAAVGHDRFLREIKVTANLSHPHVLPLHDSGATDDFLFYVMPFVEGESLRERLKREGLLPRDAALRIASDVADALDYAHARGIVHRDIKPENILLQDGRAVVADFGVALAVRGEGGQGGQGGPESERLTDAGLAIGTLAYMSPEQLQGQPLDGRTDQYALACVVWEMLGGSQPFDGTTPEAMVTQKLIGRTADFRAAGAKARVPRDIERAVVRALSSAPADRYATAGQFIAAMAGTAPVPLRYRVADRVRSWRTPVLVAAAGALTGVSGLGWFAWPFFSEPSADDRHYLRSVAVLYFDNQATTAPASAFAEAITENVSARLSRIRRLRVASALDVQRYRRAPKAAVDVARELGVDAVLQGVVTTTGDSMRLQAQLLDGEHGYVMWTHTATGSARDVFAMQDTIASTVARILALALSRGERQAIHRAPTGDFTAYQLYLEGLSRLTRWNASGLDSAVRLFEAALERDSSFVDAHAQLAFAHLARVYFGYAESDVLEQVTQHSAKALEADPSHEVALLGTTAPNLLRLRNGERLGAWELRNLIVACKRLFERSPDSPMGNIGIAHFYLWVKRDSATAKLLFRRVLSSADVALQVDSSNQFIRGMAAQASGVLANIAAREGNLKGAIELSELSLRYVPGVTRTLSQLSSYYSRAGQDERALATLQQAADAQSTTATTGSDHVMLGAQYYRMRRLREAERSFETGVKKLAMRDPLRDYALLYWLILAERRGDTTEPAQLVRERLASESDQEWLTNLVAYYDGRIDEEHLLRKARQPGQRCEAFYAMGARASARGRAADARRYFESAIATGMTGFLEYDFAKVELQLLDGSR